MWGMRQVLLRLPDELYDRTRAKAEREHRSLNAQIVHVLDADTAAEEAQA
jgi:hypothetical protein